MDYRYLEGSHDYIQWMFPNHYGSGFNSEAQALNYIESEIFLKSEAIGLKMVKSIFIFLDFMGVRLSLEDGTLTIVSLKRLNDVIVKHCHNHLRLMRIMACLSVTGFRKIALNIITLLDYITSANNDFKRERRDFEKQWEIYDNS